MHIHEQLLNKILEADRLGASLLMENWAAERGHEGLLTEVLEPVLQRIGLEWAKGDSFSLAQAYVAGKVAEDALTSIAAHRSAEAAVPPTKGPVVLGNIEEDFHGLGRRMVATFLRLSGWQVEDLGNDVPHAVFVDSALKAGARVIGASAMMMTTARNIRLLREEIDRRGLRGRLQLAVGGAVFLACPSLAEEVGADGTAPNALATNQLFDRLWKASLDTEAGP